MQEVALPLKKSARGNKSVPQGIDGVLEGPVGVRHELGFEPPEVDLGNHKGEQACPVPLGRQPMGS
jgi:hypothetical protein